MIHIFDDIEELSQSAAELFIEAADIAIRERGRFSVALSGGNTPRTLFVLLAHAPSRPFSGKMASRSVIFGSRIATSPFPTNFINCVFG